MKNDDLIRVLEKALNDEDLGVVVSSALSAVRSAQRISISDEGDRASVDRRSILDTYLLRQRRLKRTEGTVEGFDETISSLGKRQCSRIHVITVGLGDRSLTLLTEPTGDVVGCFFLEPPVDSPQM